MILKWNPFALATHNQIRMPRIAHHAAHVALGVAAWLVVGELARGSVAATVAIAIVLAWYEKHVWIDWHRTSGRVFHGWVANTSSPLDWASDLALTVLGALVPFVTHWTVAAVLAAVAVYYVLSLVNDP